nr:hypothetical protein [Mucilaginibacter sp. X5P1]
MSKNMYDLTSLQIDLLGLFVAINFARAVIIVPAYDILLWLLICEFFS